MHTSCMYAQIHPHTLIIQHTYFLSASSAYSSLFLSTILAGSFKKHPPPNLLFQETLSKLGRKHGRSTACKILILIFSSRYLAQRSPIPKPALDHSMPETCPYNEAKLHQWDAGSTHNDAPSDLQKNPLLSIELVPLGTWYPKGWG